VFRPGDSPAPLNQSVDRLEGATAAFETDAASLGTGTIDHPFFGQLALVDFVRLQEIHTRHHQAQVAPLAV
jgi:hypothetical protein